MKEKIITLDHVSIKNQLANIFTNILYAMQFEKLRSVLSNRRCFVTYVFH